MGDVLIRIKRAVLAGCYAFSEKARLEMEADGLIELDIAESILNAVAIYKRIRSKSPFRQACQRVSLRHSKHKLRRPMLSGVPARAAQVAKNNRWVDLLNAKPRSS